VIEGRDLSGRTFAGNDDVHVALQVRGDPEIPVAGDAPFGRCETDVRHVNGDFRGPAVYGRRGERFLYLTWGSPGRTSISSWATFRRAKLMLDRVDPAMVAAADEDGRGLLATVVLTDERGGPSVPAWIRRPCSGRCSNPSKPDVLGSSRNTGRPKASNPLPSGRPRVHLSTFDSHASGSSDRGQGGRGVRSAQS